MASYTIGNKTFGAGDPELQRLLPQAHAEKLRPVCCCKSPGVAMYVAKVYGKFIIKRMPDTGGDHTCRRRFKFEPPRRPNIEPGVEADGELVGCG
jgi:hypothetical protein